MLRIRWILPLLLAGCATGGLQPVPPAWMSAAVAPRYAATITEARHNTTVHVERGREGQRLVNGEKPITPWYRAIDSFDTSAERKEVIFSAKRNESFDIGLVSVDGSDVHWIPEDPEDETDVQWAPRGNKVSYIVHSRVGDYIRTVHIPTSTALTIDFPHGRVHAVRWEPKAERFDVAWESVDASERIESMTYGGEERRITTPPAVRLDVEQEPAGAMLLLRPPQLRYGEKLPLVIWIGDPTRWDDARGALLRNARVAVAIGAHADWNALATIPWIDKTRVYAVGVKLPEALSIVADASLPAGRYARADNTIRVPPAVVKSFAAGFIADQWKRTAPPDGRNHNR
jgi:hypothetical protein